MLRENENTTEYAMRVRHGDCTDAEHYVCTLPDFDVKKNGDFEIEDMERAYNEGYSKGCKTVDFQKDTIITFLKKELIHKTSYRQTMKRQYRELRQKYEALLAKSKPADTRFAEFVKNLIPE